MSAPLLHKKFARDLVWNYAAFAILALCGILINVLLAARLGAGAVGAFSQLYAVWIVASQLAAWGVHLSTLKHTAEFAHDKRICGAVLWSAMFLVAATSAAAALLLWLGAPAIGDRLGSSAVEAGIAWMAPGLVLFSVNKVMLAGLNGLRRMRWYAVGQSIRSLGILAAVGVCAWRRLDPSWLGLTFSLAEVGVTAAVAASLAPFDLPAPRAALVWMRRHASFGVRGLPAQTFLEANGRVDVLMLGAFASDATVGVYSFAAMVGEGMLNLLVVVKNLVNPMLVPLVRPQRHRDLREMLTRVQRIVWPAALVAAALLLGSFAVGVQWLFGAGSEYREGVAILALLLAGLVAYAGFVPFDEVLLQGGRPGLHSILLAASLATNIALNGLLIPWLGMHGAATATAIAIALTGLYLNALSYQSLGTSVCFFWPRGGGPGTAEARPSGTGVAS